MKTIAYSLLAVASAFAAPSALACASCGCTLNDDWSSAGLSGTPGWSLDLRYDTLDQDQLRSGTGTISAQAAANTINPTTASPAEVERYTHNRYLTATLDYSQGDTWGVSLIVPYINRTHSTLGTGSPDGVTPGSGAYDSSTTGWGDIRVVGRYFGLRDERNFGIKFGLKLPTGKTSQMANDGVTTVDPGLQLGTGTTDLILGAYYLGTVNQDWDYFVDSQLQSALADGYNAGGDYRPGDSVNITLGTRYHGFERFTPDLQLNVRYVKTDTGGPQADQFSTGGTLAYLTPGVTVPVSERTQLHANVQIPIYQNLNGIQLAPTSIVSVGVRFAF